MKRNPWCRGFVMLASLVALGYVCSLLLGATGIDAAWIDGNVRSRGFNGELLFLAAGALSIAVGAPRQSLSFLGGYAFGFILGAVWALLATSLGGVICFYYSRLLAGDVLRRRFSRHIQGLEGVLTRCPFLTALFIRLLPVGNNLVTNVAAGVSRVRPPPFFAGSLLGYAPQTVVFALAGSGIGVESVLRIGLGVVLFVVSGMLGVWLYGRYWRAPSRECRIPARYSPRRVNP